MVEMCAQFAFSRCTRWPLVDSRAKQAQDARPLRVMQRSASGLVQSTYGLRSHPSLHRRSGMEVSGAQPLLSRLSPAPLIPARPFGLGWRFDKSPSSNAILNLRSLALEVANQTREGRPDIATKKTGLQQFSDAGIKIPARAVNPFLCQAVVARQNEPRCAANPHRGFAHPEHCQAAR